MKRNKLLLSIVLLMALVVTACGNKDTKTDSGSKTTAATVLKIGHVEPEDRSTQKALLDFKKEVEEKSNGNISVEIYPNGALGGDVQLTESVAMGTLDMALPSTSVLTTYSNDFGVLDMPYLFISANAAFDAMDNEVGEYFNNILEGQNIKCLGYSYNGPRSTTTNTKPIESPADLVGVKMRVMESPIFIDYYKTLGANPTPMSFTELYTGLQQGTVEAQENPPSLILANKFYEVQKYLSVDEHVHNFLAFIMNKTKFDSLSEDDKNIIVEASKSFIDNQRKIELQDNEAAIEKLKTEGGLEVNYLNDEQKEAFKSALKPLYDKYQEEFGKELFEKCEQYNK